MKKILALAKKVCRHAHSVLVSIFIHQSDKNTFNTIYRSLRDTYVKNKGTYNFGPFIVAKWKENMESMESYFINDFSFSFLNHNSIKYTMFPNTSGRWKNIQKVFIKSILPWKTARTILKEYSVGRPLLNDFEYATSGNSIHHLYHFLKFQKEVSVNISTLKTVVEVGGGYGNMAKIFRKLNSSGTYIIIDIPIFSYIQSAYLKTVFGDDQVYLIKDKSVPILQGKINVIPLDVELLATVMKDISADLFVSTWALSESNKEMQELVKGFKYFQADYLLLAYQKINKDFAFAEDIQNVGEGYNKLFNDATEYVDDSFYLFCKKNK